jgi:hypothetical protein
VSFLFYHLRAFGGVCASTRQHALGARENFRQSDGEHLLLGERSCDRLVAWAGVDHLASFLTGRLPVPGGRVFRYAALPVAVDKINLALMDRVAVVAVALDAWALCRQAPFNASALRADRKTSLANGARVPITGFVLYKFVLAHCS